MQVEDRTKSHPPNDGFAPARASIWLRFWLAIPDWTFRALGASFFICYTALRFPEYTRDFWRAGPWYENAHTGFRLMLPWARILIDLTYLLIALSFIIRTAPKSRARRPAEILLPMIAAFWPFLPFAVKALLRLGDAAWATRFDRFMLDPALWTPLRFILGSSLILVGNALDVWGYAVLLRSLSIVAEARELRIHGPYRFVRHPIYAGQIMAQAGVWLCFAPTHWVWISFFLCFLVMQLVRARLEEGVLEAAFGEPYRAWKARTFWFTT